MRSFIKKLAGAMALSLVVTSVAPAGATALAASDLQIALQSAKSKTEAITEYSIALDAEPVNFKFYGAVSTYKELNPTWVSSNENVATVNEKGEVTPIANGMTTITFKLDNGQTGSIDVTVGTPVVYDVILGTSKDAATTALTLEVGATADLNFYGVKDWAGSKYTCDWTSTNEDVATVDKMGVVTAIEAGETIINVTIKNKENGVIHKVAPVVVTVPSVKVTPTPEGTEIPEITPPAIVNYTAKQKSEITFDVNFTAPVSYGRENVQLYRIFDTDEGDVYVVWAVEGATLSKDGMTLTVEPYVQFGDNERYLVKFNDKEEGYEFTTYIGEITHVTYTWKSFGETGKAYTYGEDAETDLDIQLSATLWSGDVDLTNIYKNEGYIEYVVVSDSDSDYYSLSDDILVFTKAGQYVNLQAQYVYEDAEGNEKKAVSKTETIISEMVPKYEISYIEEWTIVKDEETIDWTKPVHEIPAGKEDYKVAALIKDNRGKLWSTYETYKANDAISGVFGSEENEHEDMFVQFYSTDTDNFLVDIDGTLKTYTQMNNAVVYVALHDEERLEGDYDDTFVRNIGAFKMKITKESQLDDLIITTDADGKKPTSSVTLVTNAVEDLKTDGEKFIKDYTTKLLYLWNKDQYGSVYNEYKDTVTTDTYVEYVVTSSNKDIKEFIEDGNYSSFFDVDYEDDGTGTVEINAAQLNELTSKASVTFVITANQYNANGKVIDSAKATIKVSLKDPEVYAKEATDIPTNREAGNVKVTSWALEAGNAGLNVTKGSSAATITIPMLSKSYEVGLYNRYNMDSNSSEKDMDIQIITNTEDYSFKTDKLDEVGIYVMVTGPDGKAVKTASGTALGIPTDGASASSLGLGVWVDKDNYAVKVNVAADNNDDTIIDYLETGKYTVKTTFVTNVDADGKITYKTRTDNFEVSDNIHQVVFVDMNEVESELTVTDEKDMSAIKSIVCENYKFKFDSDHDGDYDEWIPEYDEIESVNCLVKGDYIIIKSITFKLDAGEGKYYRSIVTDINRSVKLGVELD